MKEIIVRFREFLLRHFKNPKLQTLICGLISYEMIVYIIFGILTSLVDYGVYSALTYVKVDTLIANIISTICAIIFAYFTNRTWVFKSKTSGFRESLYEFVKFSEARVATLLMSEFILFICKILDGNPYMAKIIAMFLTVVINYILSKFFIFTSNRKETKKNEKQI